MKNNADFPLPYINNRSVAPAGIEWQAGIAFESFGVKIGVRINRQADFYKIFRFFPPFWKKLKDNRVEHLFSLEIAENPNDFSRFYQNEKELNYAKDADWIIAGLEPMFRLTIGEFSPNRIFIHAGVVGWNDQALIFPARSGSGKSTLIRELIKKGATYYSDEFAVIDKKGLIYPYPKLLSIRENWLENHAQVDYPCEAFGANQGIKPLKLSKVFLLDYKKDSKAKIKLLSKGLGMLEILKHTVSTQNNPQKTLEFLQTALKDAEILHGKRGEAEIFAEIILK